MLQSIHWPIYPRTNGCWTTPLKCNFCSSGEPPTYISISTPARPAAGRTNALRKYVAYTICIAMIIMQYDIYINAY